MAYSRRITKSLVFSGMIIISTILAMPLLRGIVFAIKTCVPTVLALVWPPWYMLGAFIIITMAHYFLADPTHRPSQDNWKLPWE